jgi:4-hydroxy-4-methyl-2-oxoglutarate aldolase
MPVTKAQLDSFSRFFTPLVSDAMDRLGFECKVLPNSVQSIPFDPHLKVAGIAFPCRVVATNEYVEIAKLLEMVDHITEDSIVMVAADADTDAALWGGLMSTRAKARGARAAVVNGGIRDFEQIAGLAFPVFGKSRCIKDIRRRGYMVDYNIEVNFDGQIVRPGDVIFGDANGVLVIPHEHFDAVYAELMKSIAGEDATARGLQSGRSAQELFAEFETF